MSTSRTKIRRLADTDDLAIRFVNTVAWRRRSPSEERLASPEALLAWIQENGLAVPEEIASLGQAWKSREKEAIQAYEAAILLRETIYSLLISQIRGEVPPAAVMDAFSDAICQPCHLRLAWYNDRFVWQNAAPDSALDLLRPIALSAAELLTGNRADRIKQCQDDRGCGWLFVDDSRLRNRRWCSMGDCGNIAKARRHRERSAHSHRR